MDQSERLDYKLFVSENVDGYSACTSPGDPREDKKHYRKLNEVTKTYEPRKHMPVSHYFGDNDRTSIYFKQNGNEYVFTRRDIGLESSYVIGEPTKEDIRLESIDIGPAKAKEICLEELLKIDFHPPYKLIFIFKLNAEDWELF